MAQIFGMILLLFCVMMITDEKNNGIPPNAAPYAFGLCLVLIGSAFGTNCYCPLNPARDLSPRFFTAIAGWGWECFSLVFVSFVS